MSGSRESLFDVADRSPESVVAALQPIERIQNGGASGLTIGELLRLIADADSPAASRAEALIKRLPLEQLVERRFDDWIEQAGVDRSASIRLAASSELCRRVYRRERKSRPVVDGPRAAHRQVRHLGRARKEHLVGIYLDAQNGVLARETLSIGSLNTTRTHPREVLFPAVQHLALAFVLAHNHPSGCGEPSREDVEFTAGMQRAAELFGIELYDHLIVTAEGYTSLRERGLL